MKRLSVWLSEEQEAAIIELSGEVGAKRSEWVRQSIDAAIDTARHPERITIVPADDSTGSLVAPSCAADVAGLQAEIRLPAFKQRLVPYLHGHVTFVAQDVTMDDRTRATFYRAHIVIDQDQLARMQGVQLVPGMPVEAMIQIGERSFLRYITQPIRDSFTRAFREQ